MNPQLGIVMLGNQVLNNFREMCLATWIQKGRAATTPLVSTSHPWEMDNELEDMPSLALFYEYLEMVVQVWGILSLQVDGILSWSFLACSSRT